MRTMQGQALAETILVLAGLVLFFICGIWLFRQLGYAQELQAQAAEQVFQAVYQHPKELTGLAVQTAVEGPLSSVWSSTYRQLGLGRAQVYGVHLTQAVADLQGLGVSGLQLRRHAYWMAESGASHSDTDTRQRLEQAELLWQSTAHTSQSLVSRLRPAFTAIEGQWGSAAPRTDWLQPWEDYVPLRKD